MDLHLDQISKQFGERIAIKVPALTIESGRFFTFVGPSGSGKSTLLNLIAGRYQPTTGTIRVGKRGFEEPPAFERDIAFMLQEDALYMHRSTYDNIAFPLKIGEVPGSKINHRVRETAELLGVTDLLSHRLGELSGVEQQRVALGCAIIRKPRFLLLDEPLLRFDASLRFSVSKELKRLHRHLSITFIHSTSDQGQALSLSDQIAVLCKGRVLQVASPTRIYDEPANTFIGAFFGSPPMNVVPGILEKDGAAIEIGNRSFQLDGAVKEEFARDVLIGIRPEHFKVNRDPTTGWRGFVNFTESHGSVTCLKVECDGAEFVVLGPGDCVLRPGDQVGLRVAAKNIHVFDERGDRLTLL